MGYSSSGSSDGLSETMQNHADTVYRICRLHLHELADVEDAFQEVFIKLFRAEMRFESEEHRKAWLCRTAINQCRDALRNFWRRRVGSIEGMDIPCEDEQESEVMEAVLSLPSKLRVVIHLHYYEGYSVPEIGRMLGKKENTLYSDLHRARKILKLKLGGGMDEEGI